MSNFVGSQNSEAFWEACFAPLAAETQKLSPSVPMLGKRCCETVALFVSTAADTPDLVNISITVGVKTLPQQVHHLQHNE